MYVELDVLEQWIFNCYIRLRKLTASESYITISDYKEYFELYPYPINFYTLIDILMIIDHGILIYKQKKFEVKMKSDSKK